MKLEDIQDCLTNETEKGMWGIKNNIFYWYNKDRTKYKAYKMESEWTAEQINKVISRLENQ